MKTFNRKTMGDVKQAKKKSRQMRDLRKQGGRGAIYTGSKEPKQAYFPLSKSYDDPWYDTDPDTLAGGWTS